MLWKLFSSEEKLNEALESATTSHDLSFGVLPLASNDDIAVPEVANKAKLFLENEVGQNTQRFYTRRNPMVQLTPPVVSTSRLYLEDWSERDEARLRSFETGESWSG